MSMAKKRKKQRIQANQILESVASWKLDSPDFWRIANSILSKGKSAIPPLFDDPEVLPSAPDRVKLFPENFSKNSNFDDSGISLPVFPSRTNLKLHNISVMHKIHYPFKWIQVNGNVKIG